jgi:thioredoxin-dependent peroxiredoxin
MLLRILLLALAGCAATSPGRGSQRASAPDARAMENAAAAASPAVGLAAPGFSALDQNRRTATLSEYGGRYVILYFYPKDDTPGCVCEATEFTDLLYRFHELEGDVVGVSPDSPESHKKFETKYGLQVRLLADPEHAIMREYGAWVDARIGDARHGRVVRTTYILDPGGRIAWHWPEVIPSGHAARVNEKLAELRAAARPEPVRQG